MMRNEYNIAELHPRKNPYALKRFQEQMIGEAEKAGLFSEEDVANWITQSRHEDTDSGDIAPNTVKEV